jgi:HEAT repeat protein
VVAREPTEHGGLAKPRVAGPPIIAKLKTEKDWRVRIGCARALGNLGYATPEAKAVLESIAASRSHPDVIKAATEALAKLAIAGK